jgi:glycosyltransferase involved in cell wall biosynthesis
MSLNVRFVTPYFYPYIGGVQKCVLRIAQNLVAFGCNVEIVTSDFAPAGSNFNISSEKFTVKRLRCTGRIAEVPLVPELCSKISDSEFDILHINGMYPLFTDVATFAAWKHRIPVVLNYHFDPITSVPFLNQFSQIYSKLAPYFLKKATAIVATGEAYIESSPILSKVSNRIQVIPNAVEDSFFNIPSKMQLNYIMNRLDISDHEKIILFVGQLKSFKGIDVLLKVQNSEKKGSLQTYNCWQRS